jgi:thiol-disulfide isomerase/thioredoxin
MEIGMIRLRRAGALVPLAVALLLGACSGKTAVPPAPGRTLLPATPTALPTFDFATFQTLLSQIKGKPVVVNLWGSWCGPCISEAPELAKVSKEYRGRVQFLGVDLQDQPAPARAFIRRFGWTYPSVFDPSASIQKGLGLLGQPVTLIFKDGRQIWVYPGPVNAGLLRTELNAIL